MSAFTINTQAEGNLTADPVLRNTSDGTPVANMRLAVTRSVKVGDGEFVDKTEYINVVAWRSLAVNAVNSLSKGDRVIVVGTLRANNWEQQDGTTRYDTEIHADMLGASLRWALASPVKAKDMAEVPAA